MAEKLPWFAWYPADWLSNTDVHRCSFATRGVWIEIICHSFNCQERGIFATNGIAWSLDEVAAIVGGNPSEVLNGIQELLAKDVCAVRKDGALIVRRVVRDEEKRKTRSRNGRLGGNPYLSGRLTSGYPLGKPPGLPPSDSNSNSENSRKGEAGETVEAEPRFVADSPPNTEGFPEFWQAWPNNPRKTGMELCQKIWQDGRLSSQSEAIQQALAIAVKSDDWRKKNGQFIPKPARWLSEKSWSGGVENLKPKPAKSAYEIEKDVRAKRDAAEDRLMEIKRTAKVKA